MTLRVRHAVAATLLMGVAAVGCANPGAGQGGSSASAHPPEAVTASPVPSSPPALTEADTGRTLALRIGDTVRLRLSGTWRWSAPVTDGVTTEGPSLALVPVEYESDPGYREWEIRALRPGTTTVRSTGRPGPRTLELTFRVGSRNPGAANRRSGGP
jgi:predicted secreted protein